MSDFGKTTVVSYNGSTDVHICYQGCLPDDYFGDGSDSDGNITIATTLGTGDKTYVKAQYRSLKISGGGSLSPVSDCTIFLVLVQGDCTIEGSGSSLNCDWRGAYANPASGTTLQLLLKKIQKPLPAGFSASLAGMFSVPAAGATGGVGAAYADPGANGSAGVNGQTGGGGAGNSRSSSARGGHGGQGSAVCGGSGGGGCGYNSGYTQGGDATGGCGSGGNGGSSGGGTWGATGGAGNDPGVDNNCTGYQDQAPGGGGGVLILLVGGTLRIGPGARISADGSRGSNTTAANYAYCGGGAGGGRVIVLARRIVNEGTVRANGGAGGRNTGANYSAGGDGGAGCVDIAEIA